MSNDPPAAQEGDRPRIVCLMTSSLDGRLHPGRWTASPDGDPRVWSADYERVHDAVNADGWLVGRATMAEMAKGSQNPLFDYPEPARPHHFASRRGPFAITIDRSSSLHFDGPAIGGDHLVVLLGRDVADSHLAELAAAGVSYIVADDREASLLPLLVTLRRELGVATLMLEGGGHINGAFLAEGMVDELHVVLAPALDGSPGTAIVEAGADGLKGRICLALMACEVLTSGAVHLRYTVEPA